MARTAVKVAPDRMLTFDEIVQYLVPVLERSPAEFAILFGSHARGEAQPYSDVDLLVVSDADFSWHDLKKACPVEMDLHVRDTERLHESLASRDILYETIAEEGRVVYNRDPRNDPIKIMISKKGKEVTDLQQRMSTANRLLETARKSVRAVEFFQNEQANDWACFHSQQTIEMSLKALSLNQGDRRYLYTHDLTKLLDRVRESYPYMVQFEERFPQITEYYFTTRYAGPEPGLDETKEAAEIARHVYAIAREQVSLR